MAEFSRRAHILLLLAGLLLFAKDNSAQHLAVSKTDRELLQQCVLLDRKFEKRDLIYHDTEIERHLTDLAGPLLPDTPQPQRVWTFRILRLADPVSFSLPSGGIYISAGVIARLENDDQLSAVLAHEITHVIDDDGIALWRSFRRKEAVNALARLTASVAPIGAGALAAGAARTAGDLTSTASQLMLSTIGTEFTSAVLTGYKNEQECRADRQAISLLKRAGYNPAGLASALELLAAEIKPRSGSFETRLEVTLGARMACLTGTLGQNSPTPQARDRYTQQFARVLQTTAGIYLDEHRFQAAVAVAQILVSRLPENSINLGLLARAYLALDEASPPEDRTAGTPYLRKTIRELFERALQIDPSFARAHSGLGALDQMEGRVADALWEYKRYQELAPNAPDHLLIQARIAALLDSRNQTRAPGNSDRL